MENPERDEREQIGRETTSPNEPTHEATAPPGNPDRDEDAVKEAEEGLEQAGGGHERWGRRRNPVPRTDLTELSSEEARSGEEADGRFAQLVSRAHHRPCLARAA